LIYGRARRSQSCLFPAEPWSSSNMDRVCPSRRLEKLGFNFSVLRNSSAYPGKRSSLAKAAGYRGRRPRRKELVPDAEHCGDALLRFLADQKQEPSDLTVLHFTHDFLDLVLAVNSSTIETAWPKALALMSAPFRARVARESAEQKLIET